MHIQETTFDRVLEIPAFDAIPKIEEFSLDVIPAKAGIQFQKGFMDSSFRWNDKINDFSQCLECRNLLFMLF